MEPPSPPILKDISPTLALPAYFDLLPDELLWNILLQTYDLNTLNRWCQTSKRIAKICRDTVFWREKYRQDIGEPILLGKEDTWQTWKRLYTNIMFARQNNPPISAGQSHYGIIDEKGILHMAGRNDGGQLGNGTTVYAGKPVTIQLPGRVTSIACSRYSDLGYTGAVTDNGDIYLWGNVRGVSRMGESTIPQYIDFPIKAIKIICEGHKIGILGEDNSIYLIAPRVLPEFSVEKPYKLPIKGIDMSFGIGKSALMAFVDIHNQLYLWGSLAHDYNFHELSYVPTPEPIRQVALGRSHIVALSITRNVYVWGKNNNGQFGNGSRAHPPEKIYTEPIKLPLSNISFISCYEDVAAAISTDGKLYMWGATISNQIIPFSVGETLKDIRISRLETKNEFIPIMYVLFPIELDLGSPVTTISVGHNFTIAVTNDRQVKYWGDMIPVTTPLREYRIHQELI